MAWTPIKAGGCALAFLGLAAWGQDQGSRDASAVGAALGLVGQPVCIATGPDPAAWGYLNICADPYGSWSDDATYGAGPDDPDWGDEFRPLGSDLRQATFTVGFYVFKEDTHRELLTTNDEWKQNISGGPLDDDSLVSQHAGGTSEAFDTNGDGVSDTLTSSFTVASPSLDVNLGFALTQQVRAQTLGVSVMTQILVISNLNPDAISFELLRHLDANLPWQGGAQFHLDDWVGTDTNGGEPWQPRHVFQCEPGEYGSQTQSLTLSADNGDQYYGSISTHDPDGDGPCPAMGYGTDTQTWAAYGVPCAWENYIAFVGYDIDGISGDQQNDGAVGLEIPVTIAGLSQVTVDVQTTYGDTWFIGDDSVLNTLWFDPPREFAADGPPVIHALGDLDGNQTIDVAAVIPDENASLPGKVQVFRNLGNDAEDWLGLQKDENTIPVGADPSGIVLGLFNGDPHLDMAVTNGHDGDVWTFLNDGTASFTFTDDTDTGAQPSAITAGHFNADAFLDLAVTNEGDGDVVVLFGNGDGTFATGGGSAVAGGIPVDPGPVGVLSDDFNNDDNDDLAGASRGAGGAARAATGFVLRGQGDGTFEGPNSYGIGANPTDVSSGDVTRDDHPDIVTVNAEDNTVSVLINQGDGTFAGPAATLPVGAQPRSIEAVITGVTDRVHYLAVVAAVNLPGRTVRLVQVLESTWPGSDLVRFGFPLNYEVDADANHVVAGDLDADGLADLVTVNTDDGSTGGSVTVLLGDEFGPPPPCACDCEVPPDGAVDIGDFLTLLVQWGESGGSCDCEHPGDGIVDVGDFLAVLAGWGPCP